MNAEAAAEGDADVATEATCTIGAAQSLGTDQNPDLFGQIAYYETGNALPAGRYRITYVDGCIKCSGSQDWTIHAYSDGSAAWWLGAASGDKLIMPPGTVGYVSFNGAYTLFTDCVAANLLLAPIEFDFAGGQLGLWVADTNYGDNVAGDSGRNPAWKLERLGACTP